MCGVVVVGIGGLLSVCNAEFLCVDSFWPDDTYLSNTLHIHTWLTHSEYMHNVHVLDLQTCFVYIFRSSNL